MDEGVLLNDLLSESKLSDLLAREFLPDAVPAKSALLRECASCLLSMGPSPETEVAAYWVPGRVEVLGKHTDYGGGRSLLASSGRGFCFVAVTGPGNGVEAVDALSAERGSFEMGADLQPVGGCWLNFPMTVARRLCRNFRPLRGLRIGFASDLPRASGMSSSSAMLIGFSLVMLDSNRLFDTGLFRENIRDLEDLAGYLATIENGQTFGSLAGDKGVGTFGGSEDHTAILCCRPGQLSRYSFCPTRFECSVPMPEELTFAIAVSGVSADKTGRAMEDYNRASRLASEAARIWREATGHQDPHLAAIIGRYRSPDPLLEVLEDCPHPVFGRGELMNRVKQFYHESEEIVPPASRALLSRDYRKFGELVDRSQELAESVLKNQIPQTEFLARTARRLGALAASAFGAGFGGSVWALLEKPAAAEILEEWAGMYREAFPDASRRSAFFLTGAGAAARRLLCPAGFALDTLAPGQD